mgnify:CR=1 FL=1
MRIVNTTIYMIRHAKSPFVVGQELTRELSTQGLIDAKKVADIMDNKKIDLIVSSPYTRAIQTIEEIAMNKEIEIIVYEQLRERQLKGASLTENEIHQAIKTSFEDIDFHLTDGESIRDVQNRAIKIF